MEVRSSSSLYGDRDGSRGAGGKLGKPHVRKRPATPYDRPPVNLATRGTVSWWSKLSDPACRLVSGATKLILPSFFTNSPTTLPSTEPQSELEDKLEVEVIPNARGVDPYTSSYDVPKFSERTEPSQVASDRLKITYESEGRGQDRLNNLSDDSQLSRIEHLITGKEFTRDEINRLMEILNSRAGNHLDVGGEKKDELTTTSGHSAGVKQIPFSGISDERNQEDISRAVVRTPRTLLYTNANAQDDVGASPIDIAKAYMGSRVLEPGHGSQNISVNDKITAQPNDKFVMKPFTPYSQKSSTCWPGAMLQHDKHSYITPNQKGRYGLHDFPRTPFSRTIYSKSRSKLSQLQADGSQTTLSKASPQLRTPIFGQVKSRNNVLDDSYGSVGPVRGIRNKFFSEARTRGSILLNASKDAAASPFHWPSTSDGYGPTVENNLEGGETSKQWRGDYSESRFKEPTPLLNPSPSEAAKKILEQLDRSMPTPNEKAAELNLAMSWRKSPPEASDTIQKNVSFLDSGKFGPLKNTDSLEHKPLSQGNENECNSTRLSQLQKRWTEAEDGVASSSKSCGMFIGNSGTTNGVKAGSSSPQVIFQQEGSLGIENVANEVGLNSSLHLQSNGQQASTVSCEFLELSKKAQQSSGTKPVLPHISIGRHDPKRAFVSDNGSGFTFPVTSSSSVFSEPPTPTFLPVSSGSTVSDSKEVPTVPSFSFGTEKSAPRLAFSFQSSGSAPNHVDSADPKFNFGSDKKPRLSFNSVGKDAICY